MLTQIQSHLLITFGVVAAVAVIALIIAIVALSVNAKLRRQVRRWKSIHETADLDVVYENTMGAVHEMRAILEKMEQAEIAGLHQDIQNLRRVLRSKVGTPQVYRYNAFSNQGSDLSFSVALLDEDQNGVVFSSIYGREESRTYAKPVMQGASRYPLTDEETSVISQAAPTAEPAGRSDH
ncbi:DUF4446 family protein [Alicyclobacillus sp. ALC3]|uniref:DUF4446 family protein n=1 Tax=Alicyclobacillus sp. ALC3 TaxID=2796143 RepID=UPI002378BEDD|nr:DUF4446 family protein [Alicyclobacillus sp. ALC3]WDL99160.1 DUF4446 family protein [Alicyclobacillus sp. ALC3]